jgi:hypothetical protein
MSVFHRWQVEIFVDDHETSTRAEARLHSQDRTSLVGVGVVDHAPHAVVELADELAVSRALAHLAELLRDAANGDRDVNLAPVSGKVG